MEEAAFYLEIGINVFKHQYLTKLFDVKCVRTLFMDHFQQNFLLVADRCCNKNKEP